MLWTTVAILSGLLVGFVWVKHLAARRWTASTSLSLLAILWGMNTATYGIVQLAVGWETYAIWKSILMLSTFFNVALIFGTLRAERLSDSEPKAEPGPVSASLALLSMAGFASFLAGSVTLFLTWFAL